jgi:hypothetical protein
VTNHFGDGLIKCYDCGAMVPSHASLIDLPGASEHMTPCFRPVRDATMHNPDCTYCHDREAMAHIASLLEPFEREDQERNKLTIGELLDSISKVLNLNITSDDLMRVAEIGKLLLYEAICVADEENDADFFVRAYGNWGPVADAVLEECVRDYRDTETGQVRPS